MSSMLSSLRIWQKSLLPLFLSSAVALGLVFFLVANMRQVDAENTAVIEGESRATLWAARMNITGVDVGRLGWRAMAVEPSEVGALKRELEALGPQFRERAAKVREVIKGSKLEAQLTELQREFDAVLSMPIRAIDLIASGKEAEAMAMMKRDFLKGLPELRNGLRELADGLDRVAQQKSDSLTAHVDQIAMKSYLISSVSLLAIFCVGIWIALAGLVRPVAALTETMGRLAGGALHTEVPGKERGDEIGTMAKSVEGFRQGLLETERLKADQETAKQQAEIEKKKALGELASGFEASVGQVVGTISSAANELTTAATSMSSIAEETSRQATSVAAASEEASTNVQTVASATEELSSSVSEITRQVAQSSQIAGKAVSEAEKTNESVQSLAQSAASIGEVVKLIADIASQTNLLALNATIEAARAGDAGKGFAVVASEVKNLASQTARATDDISGKITEIQSATTANVGAIERITKVIREMNEITTAIASAVEEQGASTQEIARNVQQAAAGTRQVSSNITAVTQASAETGTAATQVQSTSAELSKQAESLRTEVDRFLVRVRAA
jgi:methyl-accepting chemotaxis protein